MRVHLVDGTYELFRHHFGAPSIIDEKGAEVGAVVGVLRSILALVRGGATHIGVATDHVVESFRNDMWEGYKRGDGIEPVLLAQFKPLETALEAMGIAVWPMVEYEADDALASAAAMASADPEVKQVVICTPDKDLGQCVDGDRVVQLDRRKKETRNADGVRKKFGVFPESIPDYLGLVGDTADGFPGLAGWGAKSAATVLARYRKLEAIPKDPQDWDITVRGAAGLAGKLREDWKLALLFRDIATLRRDIPLFTAVNDLEWIGPTAAFPETAAGLTRPRLLDEARKAAER